MTRLNWSTLKYLAVSPRLLQWRVEHPRPDTAALRLGRAVHALILLDERPRVQGPCSAVTKAGNVCGSVGSLAHDGEWYCRVRGHAPEGAAEVEDVIGPDEAATVSACVESLRAHRWADAALTGGRPEVEIEWTDPLTHIACRGRLDYLRPDRVVDLKTTRRGTPEAFARDVVTLLYHGQVAWYHDGALAAGVAPSLIPPAIVSVETVEPYDVACWEFTEKDLAVGRSVYRDLIRRYRACEESGMWPGHSPDPRQLALPPWAGRIEEQTEDW